MTVTKYLTKEVIVDKESRVILMRHRQRPTCTIDYLLSEKCGNSVPFHQEEYEIRIVNIEYRKQTTLRSRLFICLYSYSIFYVVSSPQVIWL